MSAVRIVEEDEAKADVKEIYGDIKSTLGIDFVPNMAERRVRDCLRQPECTVLA